MPRSRTKPSTSKLFEFAKHVRPPAGVVSTGWPAVEHKCRDLGVSFRPWQAPVGRLILAKRADGKYAATIGGTGLSIPRQVGKTFLVGAIIFALCLLRPGLTVIWTAHRMRTSAETFKKMQGFARRKKIAPYVARIVRGSGEEEIEFRNGSRILFGARERGFGRGFDEVDVLIFDEGQILTEAALDDMIPATNQSRQATGALLLFMGTPPKPTDKGEVFARMRADVLSGEDPDTCWVEFGADDGFAPTPLPEQLTTADWRQVAKANPSYPGDTPREAILRMRKKLGPDSFVREGLGIWDAVQMDAAFGPDRWEACSRPPSDTVALEAVGLASTMDLTATALVAAGTDGDLVQVQPLQKAPGTGWVTARCKELQDEHDCDVVVDGRGPAKVLIPHLEAAGVRVTVAKTPDVYDACSSIYERVRDRRVSHHDYPELDEAVARARRHRTPTGWVWRPRDPEDDDIAALNAMTLAAWKVSRPDEPEPESAYEARGVLTV